MTQPKVKVKCEDDTKDKVPAKRNAVKDTKDTATKRDVVKVKCEDKVPAKGDVTKDTKDKGTAIKEEKPRKIKVYIGGSFSRNGTPDVKASFAIHFGPCDPRNFARQIKISEHITNFRMYLIACIAAIWGAIDMINSYDEDPNVTIVANLPFTVNEGINDWMNRIWVPNNWKLANGKLMKNLDLWVPLHALLKGYPTIRFAKPDAMDTKPMEYVKEQASKALQKPKN